MRFFAIVATTGVAMSLGAGFIHLLADEPQRTGRLAGSSDCVWSSSFHLPDVNYDVYALTMYDDGTGPALYAGGWFTTAGAVHANSVARWDGSTWTALEGKLGEGASSGVNALAIYDEGFGPALYAGGLFTTAGGVPANHVARWHGGEWSALADGVDGEVFAFAVFDDGTGPALFVAGRFHLAGGIVANNIARWDGAEWNAVSGPSGNGTDNGIRSLVSVDHGPVAGLYAGGSFSTAGGVQANAIARWDGSGWTPINGPAGNGVSGGAGGPTVMGMAVYDDGGGLALYAGGWFTSAGGVEANNVARWDGTSWSALVGPSGNGIGKWVYDLAVVESGEAAGLYAGGDFLTAGGEFAFMVARWDGSAWNAVSSGCNDRIHVLDVMDLGEGPALYAGGKFTRAGTVGASYIARWDGSVWSVVAGPHANGVNDSVFAMAEHDDGSGSALYAGGRFTTAGGLITRHIARWDGNVWSDVSGPIANGLLGTVEALAVYDDGIGPALYAGGLFGYPVSTILRGIARWDGSEWSSLGGPPHYGTDGHVYALCVYDDGGGPVLYVGGSFDTAGGETVNHIGRWDGNQWSALSGSSGAGVSGHVGGLVVYDDGGGPALYAGGTFVTAGGMIANNVARWDGGAWSPLSGPLGTGTNGSAGAVTVFDDGSGPALYAGGYFSTAGGVPAHFIARWNGKTWSALEGPAGNGLNGPVTALAVHDDGNGPALFAGGVFDNAGGVSTQYLARWDGTMWSPVEGTDSDGTNSVVHFLGSFNDGYGPALYGGGWFTKAGGLTSIGFFRWQCMAIFADGFEAGNTSAWSQAAP